MSLFYLLFINFYRKNSFVLSFYPIFFIVRQRINETGDVGRVSLDNFWIDLDPLSSFLIKNQIVSVLYLDLIRYC